MATIRDHVRANLGETYSILTDTGDYDQQPPANKPDVVGLKVDMVMSRLFKADVVEDDLSEFARGYVGVMVTRAVLPLALDYYMVRTRLQDNLGQGPGVVSGAVGPGGGAISANYNRVQAILNLETLLALQQAEMKEDFLADTADQQKLGDQSSGIRVSSSSGDLLTDNPLTTFLRPRGIVLFGGEFGVAFGVVPDSPAFIVNLDG